MNIRSAAIVLTTCLASAGMGYGLRGVQTPATPAAATTSTVSTHATRPAAAPQAPTDPVIVVASDGNVTLNVQQQPLEWVLEQIAAQSGWTDVKARASAAAPSGGVEPAVNNTPCADPWRTPGERTDRLMQDFQRGAEQERYTGLLMARTEGAAVPETALKTAYETDASDRVRLLAFEAYIEPRIGDPSALRSALEAALLVPNAAVQQEARNRLDELNLLQRLDAASPQRSGS
jgi:hypothetical protein